MKYLIFSLFFLSACNSLSRVGDRIQKVCGTSEFEIQSLDIESPLQKKISLLRDQIKKYEAILPDLESEFNPKDFLDYKKNIQDRIQSIYEILVLLPESMADEFYAKYKFLDALELYLVSELALENITPISKKKILQDRISYKKKIVVQSAEKEVYLKVKSYITEANYYFLQDRKAQSNRLISATRGEMDESPFLTDQTIELYNEFVVGIMKQGEYVSKECRK